MKFKKLYAEETRWNEATKLLTNAGIKWNGGSKFFFDLNTAVITTMAIIAIAAIWMAIF